MCFTVPNERRITAAVKEPAISKTGNAVVYEFDGADSLLDMIKTVGKENLPAANSLYKSKSRYRLVLPKFPGSAEKKINKEYGKLIGRKSHADAATNEH